VTPFEGGLGSDIPLHLGEDKAFMVGGMKVLSGDEFETSRWAATVLLSSLSNSAEPLSRPSCLLLRLFLQVISLPSPKAQWIPG
jgi:hypothetical protein